VSREPYRLRVAGPAARAMTGRLPEKIAAAIYEIDEDARTVTVTAVEHRADAYRSR
jgi:mRNA interferase RelE/StbE